MTSQMLDKYPPLRGFHDAELSLYKDGKAGFMMPLDITHVTRRVLQTDPGYDVHTLPNISSPWPSAWVEFGMPDYVMDKGTKVKMPKRGSFFKRTGVKLWQISVSSPETGQQILRADRGVGIMSDLIQTEVSWGDDNKAHDHRVARLYEFANRTWCKNILVALMIDEVEHNGRSVLIPYGAWLAYLDENGRVIGYDDEEEGARGNIVEISLTQAEQKPGFVTKRLYPVLYALSLANCVNVKETPVPVSRQVRRRVERNKENFTRYFDLRTLDYSIDPPQPNKKGVKGGCFFESSSDLTLPGDVAWNLSFMESDQPYTPPLSGIADNYDMMIVDTPFNRRDEGVTIRPLTDPEEAKPSGIAVVGGS